MKRPLRDLCVLAPLLLAAPSAASAEQEPSPPAAPSVPSEEEARRIAAELLATFRAAQAEGDADRMRTCFDFDRLLDEAVRVAGVQLPGDEPFRQAFAFQMVQKLVHAETPTWESIEVRSVQPAESGGLRVVTRASYPDHMGHAAWWLAPGEDGWRIYDTEGLDLGLRVSQLVTAVLARLEDSPPWIRQVPRLELALAGLQRGEDPEQIEASLVELEQAGFPPELESLVHTLRAAVRVKLDDAEGALAATLRARALRPELPIHDHQLAKAYAELGRWQEALDAARRYQAQLGAEGPVARVEVSALAALGQRELALETCRRLFEELPGDAELLVPLAGLLPAAELGELRARFRELPDPAGQFEDLAVELLEEDLQAALLALVLELRELAPGDPNADYYQAEVHALRGEHRSAADLLLGSLGRAPAEERDWYVTRYLDACLELGRAAEGYANAPDKAYAFDYLCGALVEDWDDEGVRELIELHAREHPGDPWLPYYRGRLAWRADDLEAAAARFGEGLAASADDEHRSVYRWVLVEVLYEAGRGLQALAEVGPRAETWEHLVGCTLEDGDPELLAALLEARRTDAPQDPRLAPLEGVLLYLRDDEEGAAQRLSAAREHFDPEHEWITHLERCLILAALHTGRFELAESEARRSTERDGDPYFEAIVLGAQGKVEPAVAAIERCLETGLYDLEVFYEDADLGPRLAEDPGFAAFRAEYPPPR